jgi:methanogenic corrinoid protein MtbC1
MSEILDKLGECVEAGKVNAKAAFPPHLKGQPGADEICRDALAAGVPPEDILNKALIPAMARIGEKFSCGDAFVPEMLLAARAMSAAMVHMRPFFTSGQVKRKGTVVIGTVTGDLHDIGKNLVAMMIEGAGFEVVDLGVDVKIEKLLSALEKHPDSILGLSALLTTTMVNMEKLVTSVKLRYPDKVILIGGAPVTHEFCEKIGASHYAPDPQGAVEYLAKLVA